MNSEFCFLEFFLLTIFSHIRDLGLLTESSVILYIVLSSFFFKNFYFLFL